MKYILFLLLLASCTTSKYVVQDVRFTVSSGKVKIEPLNKPERLNDTTMIVKLIRKQ